MLMQNLGGAKQRALWYVMVFSGVVNNIAGPHVHAVSFTHT